jgi:uncharacterized protein
MAMFKLILLILLVGYAGIVALAYLMQRSLMYFPDTVRTQPGAAGLPEAEELVLKTTDDEEVIAWHVAPRPEKPLVLHFHGNGGSLRGRVARFRRLLADGTGLLALTYRGYGGSTGRPSEAGLIRDAEAAYAFARARHDHQNLAVWGESLGTGVAVALAADHPVGAVILEKPFTSAVDVGAVAYPFLPVRLLMKDQFRSDQRIGKITVPVLILHGERDNVVPIKFAERLFKLIVAPKTLVRYPDGDHGDLDGHGAIEAIHEFLARLRLVGQPSE